MLSRISAALSPPGYAGLPPELRHRPAQNRLSDVTLVPHVFENLVLRDDLVRVFREVDEEVHEPRPKMVDLVRTAHPVEAGLDQPVAQMKVPVGGSDRHGPRL